MSQKGSEHKPTRARRATFAFARYLPLLDPEKFADIAFYKGLEEIGYEQVLLGGTGAADLATLTRKIKRETKLTVVLYPAGPDSVAPADVVVMPDVMNSNSHYARPCGSGSVATAMNIARHGLDYVPVAYLIMGNSTARWYFDAYLLPSNKVLLSYINYAAMVGYPYIALDYEDPQINIDPKLIRAIKQIGDLRLVISDEFDPAGAAKAILMGADTVITPSDVFEEKLGDDGDLTLALAYAKEFHDALLKP
ncbi:MAG: hypothetical protein H6713_20425 [Myxococcales bacterium]|nr:hypothetical protein [Myxococcales bacterium]MCB9752327.1 hypothetical protein [Myxococcales bacterium]